MAAADPHDVAGRVEVHRAALALLAAVLDGSCDDRVHVLLCRADDPHFAVAVAHHLAHIQVAGIPQAEHGVMRAELAEELIELASG
jgi:hypothetical protein